MQVKLSADALKGERLRKNSWSSSFKQILIQQSILCLNSG